MPLKPFVVLASLALSGCVVAPAANLAVPKERVSECKTICTDIGMELGSVVIIRNSAGCVCQVPGATQSQQSASAVAGGVAIIEAEEEENRQREQHEDQRRRDEQARDQRRRDQQHHPTSHHH
ncbi:hypothetical protein MYSTI_03430 [Myxococcus stipitatus DSM 14675]|uniref:Lipoprotein n=1 Tax=Myxococcus stipitatus (strain DSM 14675 / JCM 12634 / Mx s8) TaxID=1278073 RepID=L7UAW2_MYXSD|nr:hypothetical protein [Myxococcus stipitatus]AGC44742.1 hypothetical protein MYSTI_03430 [Myxococcus stipitatus DSM 14675]